LANSISAKILDQILQLSSLDPNFLAINAEAKNVTEASKLTHQTDGRIHEEVFSVYFVNKNAWELNTEARADAYNVFVNSLFNTMTKLTAPIGKTTIDEQAFRYAALMASQFDFAGLPVPPISGNPTPPAELPGGFTEETDEEKQKEERNTSVEELVRQVEELRRQREDNQENDLEFEEEDLD